MRVTISVSKMSRRKRCVASETSGQPPESLQGSSSGGDGGGGDVGGDGGDGGGDGGDSDGGGDESYGPPIRVDRAISEPRPIRALWSPRRSFDSSGSNPEGCPSIGRFEAIASIGT